MRRVNNKYIKKYFLLVSSIKKHKFNVKYWINELILKMTYIKLNFLIKLLMHINELFKIQLNAYQEDNRLFALLVIIIYLLLY